MTVGGGGFPAAWSEQPTRYQIGGRTDPMIRASVVVAGYKKALERARECPDPYLRGTLGNGIQDTFLQVIKLLSVGDPAAGVLIDGLEKLL